MKRGWTTSVPGGVACLLVLGLLALWMKTTDDAWLPILDSANLVFHEAGHKIFGLLGETMQLYGGTLGQLVLPLVCLVTFLVRRQSIGVAVGLAWLGQNLFNIARYCADARAQELPLVGGGEHDWTHILSRWQALDQDLAVAHRLRIAAWVLVIFAIVWLAWRTWVAHRSPRTDP